VLAALRGLGVRIAIDDFGTGRCSLAQLAALPIDAIKIDRSFVSDPDGLMLVRMIVKLGKVLGLETLGEGIEDAAQLRALQALECDSGQGFHLAVPLDPARIGALIDDRAAPRDAPVATA
jgi:EAL domain-containing protein (putative c-di-GMP-specific phosphodiesterase class I)